MISKQHRLLWASAFWRTIPPMSTKGRGSSCGDVWSYRLRAIMMSSVEAIRAASAFRQWTNGLADETGIRAAWPVGLRPLIHMISTRGDGPIAIPGYISTWEMMDVHLGRCCG